RPIRPQRARAPILLDERDAVRVLHRVDFDQVAVNLRIVRRGDLDAGGPEPARVGEAAVVLDRVVADRDVMADLMEDARAVVLGEEVVLVDRLIVVAVRPPTRAGVVVRVVAAKGESKRRDELRPPGIPAGVYTAATVVVDFVVRDEDVVAA